MKVEAKLFVLFVMPLMAAFLGTGCGKQQLSGRYEYVPGTPRFDITGMDANTRRRVENDREKYQRMMGSAMVFDGPNVTLIRFGEGGHEVKCRYEIKGKELGITAESGITLPMEIRKDGIITFMAAEYRNVK